MKQNKKKKEVFEKGDVCYLVETARIDGSTEYSAPMKDVELCLCIARKARKFASEHRDNSIIDVASIQTKFENIESYNDNESFLISYPKFDYVVSLVRSEDIYNAMLEHGLPTDDDKLLFEVFYNWHGDFSPFGFEVLGMVIKGITFRCAKDKDNPYLPDEEMFRAMCDRAALKLNEHIKERNQWSIFYDWSKKNE